MAFNLIDMIKDQVSGQLINHASTFLGEDESLIKKALSGIFPALLGSIIKKGETEKGAAGIFQSLMDHDGGILDDITGLFKKGPDTLNKLMDSGSGVIGNLLGENSGGLVNIISSISGIKKESSSSLLKMAAPFLMGALGQHVRRNGLNIDGLMTMLQSQKSHVESALPKAMGGIDGIFKLGGIADAGVESLSSGGEAFVKSISQKTEEPLGAVKESLSSVSDTGKETIKTVTNEPTKVVRKASGSFWKWVIPLVILLGALFFLTQYSACNTNVEGSSETIGESMNEVKDELGDVLASISLPGGKEIKTATGSVITKLNDFLKDGVSDSDTVFTFDNVSFETGSANLTKDSQNQLTNLAYILQAYDELKIKIEGHTDNTGDAETNKTLSLNRANSVKKVLVGLGINENRILTAGTGSENPIADNGTEEGRNKNRRVDIIILAK